jgi:putative spermidine/putrescine transport system permease protein
MSARRKNRLHWCLGLYLGAFLLYMESPLLVIVVTSIIDPFGPQHRMVLSAEWFRAVGSMLADAPEAKPGLALSLWTSMWLSCASTVLATAAGVLCAYVLTRATWRGHEAVRQVFMLPMLFPQVVVGISLLMWFSALGGIPSSVRLLLGHLVLTLPYVIVTMESSLASTDHRLVEAAMNLGAGRIRAFFLVSLPCMASGVASAAVFAWLTSFSNFTVTYFLYSGETKPFPAWLYELMQNFFDPSIAALSTVLVACTLAITLLGQRASASARSLRRKEGLA